MQMVSNASSIIGTAVVANVQTEVAHILNVLLTTTCIDLHTSESQCCKVRVLFNQGSTLSDSYFRVSLSDFVTNMNEWQRVDL